MSDQSNTPSGLPESLDDRAEAVLEAWRKDPSCVTAGMQAAGYSGAGSSAVLDSTAFQEALGRSVRRRLRAAVPVSIDALVEVVRQAKDPRSRVAAAKEILDRAGFVAPAAKADDAPKDLSELDSASLAAMVQRAQSVLADRARPVLEATSAEASPEQAGEPEVGGRP